jgi:hypothetical protein
VPASRAPQVFNALGQSLAPGDVVWCAFPFHTAPRMPGEYPRPCLVLEERAIDARTHYLVAYGTTKHLDASDRYPGDIFTAPADGEHFDATGLDGPGKFRLCQTALLPAVPAFFPKPQFNYTTRTGRAVVGVKLGQLTPLMVEVLQQAWREMKLYQAEQEHRHGLIPADPLGPFTNPKNAATGRNFLRRKP